MSEGGDNPGGSALAPLYQRLPRGPHRLRPGEVAENQRNRMHGAMVESVAAKGYGGTSVKQVVSLAGVSRRAFYEQFANKQECFLATLDLISNRALAELSDAYRSTEGGLEQRMGSALAKCAELVEHNPKSARLLMIDAPSAGPEGWTRLTGALTAFEGLVAASFAHAPDAAPVPAPVVRGIVGGLRKMTLARLRAGREQELPGLVEQMLNWTLVFKTAEPGQLANVARRSLRGDGLPSPQRDARMVALARGGAIRARILNSALRLAEIEGYGNVTPLRIADEAGISIDLFFELFEDMQECFLAAIGDVGEGLKETLTDPGLTSPEWPAAVRRTLRALMHRLAAQPSYAHAIATGVFTIGEGAVELTAVLARDIAAALIAGAPGPARSELTQEGIEGAVWHTIYCQATSGRAELLPRLSDYLAYIVLTPFVGAEQAALLVGEDLPGRALPSVGAATASRRSE